MSTRTLPRTKIVCTLGPATDEPGVVEALIDAGMSVARLNLSHGTHAEHARRITRVRDAADAVDATVAILGDLQGPKLRIGEVEPARELRAGDTIVLGCGGADGPDHLPLPHPELFAACRPGQALLLDDGTIELRVESVTESTLGCRVETGGTLSSRKGIAAPGADIDIPSLTPKDRDDLRFLARQPIDAVALSFVRRREDLDELRAALAMHGFTPVVIAKIEKRQALENFAAILQAADGIMVARGDLGVEVPAEDVPMHQKDIIRDCNRAGKPVITATQMLQSMIGNPRPTRAEASDVANAILDGSDALMLSAETSVGHHPVAAVEVMARVAARVERRLAPRLDVVRAAVATDATDAIAQAAVEIAVELQAAAIVSATITGYSPGLISGYRPPTPVFAVTPDPIVQRRLAFVWGVQPWPIPRPRNTEELLASALAGVQSAGVAARGDTVVLTGAMPVDIRGRANFLKVHILD